METYIWGDVYRVLKCWFEGHDVCLECKDANFCFYVLKSVTVSWLKWSRDTRKG